MFRALRFSGANRIRDDCRPACRSRTRRDRGWLALMRTGSSTDPVRAAVFFSGIDRLALGDSMSKQG